MITWFLQRRLRRLGARPVADTSIKAAVRTRLVQAGYLPARSPWLARVHVALASSGVFIVGLGGMASYAYASDAVLPETPLYPVRQELEALELRLAPTLAARVQVEVRQKEKRKQEAKVLIAQHKTLPALHARILAEEAKEKREQRKEKEEQDEERANNRALGATSTRRQRLTKPTRSLLEERFEEEDVTTTGRMRIDGRIKLLPPVSRYTPTATTTTSTVNLLPTPIRRVPQVRDARKKEKKREKAEDSRRSPSGTCLSSVCKDGKRE